MKKVAKAPVAVLAVVMLGIAAYFAVLWHIGRPDVFIYGEAEAVAVTKVYYSNGIWNPENIFDELYYPIGIALMGEYLVVADSMGDRVQILSDTEGWRVGRSGLYGMSHYDSGAFVDGFRENAMFMKPAGVSVAPNGHILVSDSGNNAVRRITEEFVITIAGDGTAGFADGFEGRAVFNSPRAAVMDAGGYIYVADTLNHVIRRISPEGEVVLFAGSPGESGFADGSLTQARFFEPSGMYLSGGVLYIADSANHSIRRIEAGQVGTVAGRPGSPIRLSEYFEGGHVDGPNDEALFDFPRDVALLPDGGILVADSLNHAVRLVTGGATRTIVGSGAAGSVKYSAENMMLARPEGVATDGEYMFISDTLNNRVITVPLTERVINGRPSREQMLADTGLTVNSRFAFRGDIRVFLDDNRVNMGRVQPWIRGESIFVPIRPFLEALGARMELDERAGELTVFVDDTATRMQQGRDYFIMRGVTVTTLSELIRLFPYTVEWFPELSLITLHVPQDLREE
ncbi:MAG: hypothetical protein FWD98_07565 [Defluviitaleaceae bacterium]|nr:hypothetical protein [Defluviitaleaceae bacterium]